MVTAWTPWGTAQGQSNTTTQAASSDWIGYYTLARGKDLTGFKVLSPNLNQVVTAHLQP